MGPMEVAGSMRTEVLSPLPAPLYDPRHDHDACGVGFVADLHGGHRSAIVPLALEALAALAHRGARAADDTTGDGAGISFPISRRFRRRLLTDAGVSPVSGRRVAIGMCFLPRIAIDAAVKRIERTAAVLGTHVAGWREVPVDWSLTAGSSLEGAPEIRQAIVVADRPMSRIAFARALATIRRAVEADAAADAILGDLTIVSLSPSTVVYKGLFVGDELGRFYGDLGAADLDARYALFHQRYSTNTFPSWALAQPFGYLAHNGEINTIRSNREAMRGRRHRLGGGHWARRVVDAGPLVSVDGSDSRALDDALEMLLLSGMPIDRALATLVPAAQGLGGPPELLPARSEPWDGPAALVFADGRRVGALLDRNGLRPIALATTADGLVVASSEAGSVELDPGRVTMRHRLGPGELVVADTRTGVLSGPSDRVKGSRAVPIRMAAPPRLPTDPDPEPDPRARVAHGLDAEVVRQSIRPMAADGHEAIWSMGDDTPVAALATRRRRATGFLRQAFAQVTNPALDPQRELAVMSLELAIGRQPTFLGGAGAMTTSVEQPIRSRPEWAALLAAFDRGRVVHLDATWSRRRGAAGLATALDRLARRARSGARRGAVLLVLSDRAAGESRVPMPAVLAVGRVHQSLVAAGLRSATDLVVEAGDAFDVHDVAMLIAAGASAVHPWLLLELAAEQAHTRGAEELTPDVAVRHVVEALDAGLRKVLARMGISSLASYRGGQLFDTIGLHPEIVASCFPAAGAWPGATGFSEMASAALEANRRAYGPDVPNLEDPGLVRFRGSGERHAFAPPVVKATQALADVATPLDERLAAYREAAARGGAAQPRDLLGLRRAPRPLPADEVEPASRIVRRFVSSAMSLGALSVEAHQAISIGMARLGGSANSGEGGEDPAWYAAGGDGDRHDAAIKQVASARFGVTAEYLARAEQLEIKIAQGSKPGEGGQLPGRKATAFIAQLRRGQPGMTMISPPPHHDIYSIEDLAQLIGDLRAINPTARIGVKLVAARGIGTIAAGVAKAHADYILVSGHAGGTGASPLSSIKHAGLPWELGLAEVHQVLVRNRLRDRVALRTDGGLQTGRDVVVAAALGAEEYGFGTAALVALGCDMARQCHLDTCPTGIATQREDLRAKFTGTPEHVVAFFQAIAEDVRHELSLVGARSLGEIVGRTDLLTPGPAPAIDVEAMLAAPSWRPDRARRQPPKDVGRTAVPPPDTAFEAAVVDAIGARVDGGDGVVIERRVTPRDRSVGARLAGFLARRPEPRRMPRVRYHLRGSAGQSLGAFAVAGLRIVVEGEANDYVGKGLSGGTVVVRPPAVTPEDGTDDAPTIVGNVCLYGATAGALHVVGRAAMRFGVRNSGARAVVEGVGAHGCEYMTGGVVVVLGEIGPNFGAGMTGGRAFVLAGTDPRLLNADSVATRPLTAADERLLRELLVAHAGEGSGRAARALAGWRPDAYAVVEPRADDARETEGREPAPLAMAR